MSEKLTTIELRQIRKYLSKVYPGVAEQDDLWDVLVKLDKLIIEGAKHDNKTKSNSRK
jgi:hypothetical protein